MAPRTASASPGAAATLALLGAVGVIALAVVTDGLPEDALAQPNPLARSRRQIYDCRYKSDFLRFRCSSGSCIDVDRVCDGARDCDDGSDETRSQCASNGACPGLSFRCDYGACVDADARCNGISDCADGSDEHPRICNRGQGQGGQGGQGNQGRPPGLSNQGRPPGLGLSNGPTVTSSGGCRSEEHTCASGQCVDNTVVCDGRKDCGDGSDETFTQCYNVKCPSYSFRCAYGGCIDREARCDGIKHCADGSDEDQCGGGTGSSISPTRPTQTQRPTQAQTQRPSQKPTQRPAQTQRPTQRPPARPTGQDTQGGLGSQGGCRLPPRLSGGVYKVDECVPGDTSNLCRGVANTIAPHKTVLSYQCNPGFQLSNDNNVSICLNGVWNPEPPTCAKTCPPLISTSVDLDCKHDEKAVRCDKPQLPGTRATLQCKPSYRFPAGVTPDYDAVNCQPDGTWDWPLFKCIPECGVAIGKGQTLIVHGSDANIADFPWHAGIYDNAQKEGITQVCGGTLVLPNLIVSAAHCFYDDTRQSEQRLPASRYKVAVGKYYRDWDAREHGEVQKSDVYRIHLPERYRGKSRNYADDIALVELTVHVSISAVVMPVCVDWLGSTLSGLRQGDVGTVVGWGRTGNRQPSSTLQSARLPYVPFDECLKGIPETFRPYITNDKFCAGNINGSAVAKGDSGGGLAFKHESAYFLRGIVSAGVPNSITYSAFTNVEPHKEWMSKIRAEVENRRPRGKVSGSGSGSGVAARRGSRSRLEFS